MAGITSLQPLVVASKALKAARFFPVPHKFTLGLQPIKPSEWLHVPTAAEMRRKRELLDGAERSEVLDALPGSEFAQRELADAVEAHCREHAAGAPSAGAPLGDDDIELAGRLVAEDLMLMERRPEGWVLTAACLCFPSRWALADKLGRRMEEIHAPVPGLNDRLAPKISQFFDKLAPGKLVARMNSAIMDDPELHQPPSFAALRTPPPPVDAASAGERLLLRMERQTLRRLPETGAVVFTIKTHQMRLPDVAADAEFATAVREHYRSLLGTPMADGSDPYKTDVAAFVDWLDAAARLPPPTRYDCSLDS